MYDNPRIEYLSMNDDNIPFEKKWEYMSNRYLTRGVGGWDWPKVRHTLMGTDQDRLPKTGWKARILQKWNWVNSEIRRNTQDGKYWYFPRKVSGKHYVVTYEKGVEVNRHPLPDEVLRSAMLMHHKLPIVFWAKQRRFEGINLLTGERVSSQEASYNIGGYYEKGKQWSRVSGGDGHDLSIDGKFYITKEGKYGEGLVIQFSDDSLEFSEVSQKHWTAPSGADYITMSWDGSHVIVIGQKNSNYNKIGAFDFEGNEILELYGARGHMKTSPYILEDGTVVSAFLVKYNESQARSAGGNTGDNVYIVYGNTGEGLKHIKRITTFDGKDTWPPLNGGQHGHWGWAGGISPYFIKNYQYNKDHNNKHPNNPYMGMSVEIPLKDGDLDYRVIYRNGCVDSSVSKQAEGCANSTGEDFVLKMDADGEGDGIMVYFEYEARMPKDIRDRYFAGEWNKDNEDELIALLEERQALLGEGITNPPVGEDPDPVQEPEPSDCSEFEAAVSDLESQIAARDIEIAELKELIEAQGGKPCEDCPCDANEEYKEKAEILDGVKRFYKWLIR